MSSWLERLQQMRKVLKGMGSLERLQDVRKTLKELGYEKERAAAALLALSFFGIVYLLVALNAPPGWGPAFTGLSLCYLTAFVALAAEWFWSRWFASGLGWSGFMVGLMALIMVGWNPSLAVYAGLHAVIVLALLGPKMSARYEMQTAWRERYSMDEYGVARLGKAVTRASASLPTLILWALAPREGQGDYALPLLALALALSGVMAMLRLRTWSLVALAGAGALALGAAGLAPISLPVASADSPVAGLWTLLAAPAVAAVWAVLAVWPFVRPAWRYLRSGP
jgi:hypothetical protein